MLFSGYVLTEFKLHWGYVSGIWEVLSSTLGFIMKFERRTDISMLYMGETLGMRRSGFQTSCALKRLDGTTV